MKMMFNEDRITEVEQDILKIIKSMTDTEKGLLLKGLKKWYKSNHPSYREYPRKDTSIYGFFEINNLSFREHIKNLSAGGLFIETELPISSSASEELFMQFFHPEFNNLVKTQGKIVRVDSKGIGIKFDKPKPHSR
jgi:hypothetical protein